MPHNYDICEALALIIVNELCVRGVEHESVLISGKAVGIDIRQFQLAALIDGILIYEYGRFITGSFPTVTGMKLIKYDHMELSSIIVAIDIILKIVGV